MDLASIITSRYERKARLYPALLLISPVVALGAVFLWDKLSEIQFLVSIIVCCGGLFLLAQLARDAGKKKEKDLYQNWGGMPSVTIFRHNDSRLDSLTKKRYHRQLAQLVEGTKALTQEQEEADPDNADAIYTAWSAFLRTNTRDTKTSDLLFEENINYGYRRNVWGLRPLGITLSLVSFLGSIMGGCFIYRSTSQFDEPLLASGMYALLLLVLWLFRFTSDWVRVPADAYAERLAESLEVLLGQSKEKN